MLSMEPRLEPFITAEPVDMLYPTFPGKGQWMMIYDLSNFIFKEVLD